MISQTALERFEGLNLALRLIRPDDAEYVHMLRTDPTYNTHLSEVSGGVEDQRNWIVQYKARENEVRELYYVIERMDGTRCGLVRLYDISSESFTWGSWILDHNKPKKAALESAQLSFAIGFDILDLAHANVDVRIGNEKAIDIYVGLGMHEIRRDSENIYYRFDRTRFHASQEARMAILEGAFQA